LIKYRIVSNKSFASILSWQVYELEHVENIDKDILCFLFINSDGEQYLLEVEYININELEEYFFKFSVKKYDDSVDDEEAEYVARILLNVIEMEAKKIVKNIDLVDYFFYFPYKTDF
jgi:hypothetical protein